MPKKREKIVLLLIRRIMLALQRGLKLNFAFFLRKNKTSRKKKIILATVRINRIIENK